MFAKTSLALSTDTMEKPMYFDNKEKGKSIYFEESYDYFVNPYMGPVAQAKNKQRQIEGSLVLGIYTWRDIEPKKGVYDFDKVEKENNYKYWIEENNNSYMLGLTMDVPKLLDKIEYEQMDIPMWLYEELKQEAQSKYKDLLKNKNLSYEQRKDYEISLWKIQNDKEVIDNFNRNRVSEVDIPDVGTFYRYYIDTPNGREYRGGFSPNYKSELLLKYHGEVFSALAKRYDNEKTYALVMGSLGHWGEMHTYFIKNKNSSGKYPSAEIASKYELDYTKYFKNIMVSVRYPREVAKENNFGLHSHAFGDEQSIYKWHIDFYEKGYVDHETGSVHPDMKDFWKTAPSGGEFLYTGDSRYLSDENIEKTIKQARDTHLTWFNELWYGLDEKAKENQRYFYSKIGYRFVPTKVSFSSNIGDSRKLKIDSVWKNSGTAPFYKDWKLKAVLVDDKGMAVASKSFEKSIKELMPNTTKRYQTIMNIPKNIKSGKYKLYIGIYNNISQKPEIKFTVKTKDKNGLYLLGEINIQ